MVGAVYKNAHGVSPVKSMTSSVEFSKYLLGLVMQRWAFKSLASGDYAQLDHRGNSKCPGVHALRSAGQHLQTLGQ